MKLSASTWNYLAACGAKANLFAAIDTILKQGFGLELFLDWSPAPRLLLDRSHWASIKDSCRGAPGLSLHSRLISFFDSQLIREEIDLCAYLDAELLVVHPRSLGIAAGMMDYVSRAEPDQRDFQRVAETVSYAADRGVRLALENGPANILRWVRDRMKDVDAAGALGICVDTGHANLHREQDPGLLLHLVDEFREELIHVHLADNYEQSDEHNPPGEGTVHWPAFLSSLRKVGYTGRLVLEINTPDPSQSAARGREFILGSCPGEE